MNQHIQKNPNRNFLAGMLNLILCLLCACFFGACRDMNAVVVAGSTSVQPYAEILAEEFMILDPAKEVDVQGGGSSAGITAVQTGAAEIGMSSRELKDEEQLLWSVEIAKDGLAIIINPGNHIQNISIDQIRDIYAFKITNWSEIGGANKKIHIISREEGSGTRSAFEELIMGESRITPKAIIQDSNGAVRQLVADDPDSIGFISLGLVDKTVKALNLDNVKATRENILNGEYKLYRPFLFIARQKPEGDAMEYIDFVLSKHGQQLLSDEGLIPEQSGDQPI
ncbi:MAG: phosphate ABC transporter substrate-binding protein [Treponema sp.]|nr:phosphate ABC transporter substrate-binding protein [Treponema sp.]